MIKFPNGDRDRIKKILELLERADCIYNDLLNETKEICCDYHIPEGTIAHCLYYGINACEELLDPQARWDEVVEEEEYE